MLQQSIFILTALFLCTSTSLHTSSTTPTRDTASNNWHALRYYGPHTASKNNGQNPYQTINHITSQGPVRLTGRLKK